MRQSQGRFRKMHHECNVFCTRCIALHIMSFSVVVLVRTWNIGIAIWNTIPHNPPHDMYMENWKCFE